MRRLKVNTSYFKKIDTENKAYWLGYLMADGCITKNSKENKRYTRVSLNSKYDDKAHLDKFCKDIGFEGSVGISEKYHKSKGFSFIISEVKINSVELCEDLMFLGVVPNKTGKESLPSCIDNNLKKHFIRGFFDGDGSITKKGYFRIGTCSKKILEDISGYIFDNTGQELKIYSTDRYSRDFFYFDSGSKKRNKIILDFLYKDSIIRLDRKYERYLELFCSPV